MIVLLVQQGWRGPIVFADVGTPGEHPETVCFVKYFERDFLKPHGLELTTLVPGDEWHKARAKAYGLYEYCLTQEIIPIMAQRWCTQDWKLKPLERWSKAHGIKTRLVGIDAGESSRAIDVDGVSYPLCDAYVNRGGCRNILRRAGIEVPRKSGCVFCPNQNAAEWHRLYIEHPELYEQAEAIERTASARVGYPVALPYCGTSLYDLRTRRAWDGQMEMDLPGMARPCICSL